MTKIDATAFGLSVLLLSACGDDVTKVTQVTQETSGLEIVASADSLGKCTEERSGEMKFASKENAVYVCTDSAWQNVSAAEKASCAAEILKDSSGYKIVCDGDSVGVVLNGKDGADGAKGEAGKDGERGESGVSCSFTDNGDGTILQVCGKDSVTLYKAFCGGKVYDPNSSFCHEDSLHSHCQGEQFDPGTEFCHENTLYEKCAGEIYAPSSKECSDNRLFETFKDDRDGQRYRIVTIGSQIWMAENLNYAYMPDTLSFCYDNSADSCAKYGRLYTWAAAMDTLTTGCGFNGVCSPADTVRGACPDGWHLPSEAEWRSLDNFIKQQIGKSGYALKSLNGWTEHDGKTGGSDAFGFSALPAGFRKGENFAKVLDRANFWSSTWETNVIAYYWSLNYNSTSLFISAYQPIDQKNYGVLSHSIRCVKD